MLKEKPDGKYEKYDAYTFKTTKYHNLHFITSWRIVRPIALRDGREKTCYDFVRENEESGDIKWRK